LFVVNDMFSIKDVHDEKQIERILWIDEGNIICYTINISNKNALPTKRKISELVQLHEEQLLELVENDAFSFIYQDEKTLSDKSKLLRDERWESVERLVTQEPRIFEGSERGKLIVLAMKETGKTKPLLYKYLRQYWQRGKIKNALLPDYRNSGGKGKEKKPIKKMGRNRKFESLRGEGIVITEDIKRVFEVSIKRFFHTTKKNSLVTTHQEMLKTFFVADYRFENGVKIPILQNQDNLPTLRQFEYWYKKTYHSEEKLRSRKGKRKYDLEDRAILGNSVGEMYGPGSKFQIDATVVDVYLVSKFNRNWIIGRPVIYVVIDMFSRKVVGLYVGLEGPSWLGAMMALANTASDKVSYCRNYGIDITSEQWDCHYLPQSLLADRGELEGYNIDRLISAFNIKVENTAPYRGDWKGIVEQHFRIIHKKVKPFLPGYVDGDVKIRGERDYRLDATLTIEEFTSVIIKCVLFHNNHHWLKHYDQDEMAIESDVPLIPSKLWEWGIENRSGKLRSYTEEIVKLNLLPTANARVTSKGIVFKKVRYSCERGLKERWFEDARQKSWLIPICYDPRNMSQIYLPKENGRSYEVATLLDHQEKYVGKTIEEVEYKFEYDMMRRQVNDHEESQKEIDLTTEIDHIAKNARKSWKDSTVKISNNEKIKGIREKHSMEKEERRKEEAFLLSDSDIQSQESTTNYDTQEERLHKESSSKINLLRQKQKERLNYAKINRE
jgi:hypothetical protein